VLVAAAGEAAEVLEAALFVVSLVDVLKVNVGREECLARGKLGSVGRAGRRDLVGETVGSTRGMARRGAREGIQRRGTVGNFTTSCHDVNRGITW
jgi:hypothetical protein